MKKFFTESREFLRKSKENPNIVGDNLKGHGAGPFDKAFDGPSIVLDKDKKPEKTTSETTSETSSKMTHRKSIHYRKPKPRPRSPSKKKCKSKCNCASCKSERVTQEYDKRYRDASMERRQRKSPSRNKKSPNKKSPNKKSPKRKNH
jgi:hypothetical protein